MKMNRLTKAGIALLFSVGALVGVVATSAASTSTDNASARAAYDTGWG